MAGPNTTKGLLRGFYGASKGLLAELGGEKMMMGQHGGGGGGGRAAALAVPGGGEAMGPGGGEATVPSCAIEAVALVAAIPS